MLRNRNGNCRAQLVMGHLNSLSPGRAGLRSFFAIICVCMLLGMTACGGGSGGSSTPNGPVTGNWQMQLVTPNSDQAWQLSGFLIQSGNSVTGSFISVPNADTGFGCNGVGPVTGTLNGQNLKLDVNESSQDLSLSATFPGTPSSSTPVTGQFTTLAAGCTTSSATGTWSATLITPPSGSFHGTFTSHVNGPINVTGTLNQGPNLGASNATLTGTINATGPTSFCSYLNSATISGLISGTQVTLNLFGPDGSKIGQVGPPAATITPDGKSLSCLPDSTPSCTYFFSQISKSCTGDAGSVQLTFP
jgi:hypothetical protein